MEIINIKIVDRNGYQSLEAMSGCYSLFGFEYRFDSDAWYFWPNSTYNPTILYGKEFPTEYFENLCKAKYFCITGTDVWPDKVNIVSGKKYLKVAPKPEVKI